ncbi:MAG: glycerate kinase [Robiginitomaculum sp.]|nr:MAG: glycerate kinase [Robiginitomaculum sp.]
MANYDQNDSLAFLKALYDNAINAVQAARTLPPALPASPPAGRTLILAFGKAAAAMAKVAETTLCGPLGGLAVTRYGHGGTIKTDAIEINYASHPVPDEASQNAARRMLDRAHACTEKDRLIALVSGGGSSLLALPAPGLTLVQKQDVVRHLLHSGADIAQINCVRKHLSAIKGGRLAAASGSQDIHTFIISDVPGDDPAAIASGPTIADPTTLNEARAVIARFGTPHEGTIQAILHDPANETPKPGTLPGQYSIIACAKDALDHAERFAMSKGWQIHNLGDRVEGEARNVGAAHAKIALKLQARGGEWLILSGGETTVTISNKNGCGGPNLEYLGGLALALKGAPGITALACDTDGIDGSGDNAGAIITPTTLARASVKDLNIMSALENNETYRFFAALDDLIITGPSLTNVNDFRAIAIWA